MIHEMPSSVQLGKKQLQQSSGEILFSKYNVLSSNRSFSKLVDSQEHADRIIDDELAKRLSRLIEASKSNGIALWNFPLKELKDSLLTIKRKNSTGPRFTEGRN